MRVRSLVHLSPRVLLDRVADLVAREREITAELILCLAEVLRRRLYAAEGYPSMHAYCVGALGISEDSAGKRIRVVRMARRFPQILGMIADGRLHLSAVCLLAPHLTHENAAELLAAATHRTKRQIEQFLAERFPQADLPTLVQTLVPAPVPASAPAPGPSVAPQPVPAAGAMASSDEKSVPGRISGATSAQSVTPSDTHVARTEPRPRVAPLAPQRYAVQFTMDQVMHDDLRRAQELLGHRVAPGEVTDVFRRALRELVTKLERQKFAATSRTSAGRRMETSPKPEKNPVPKEAAAPAQQPAREPDRRQGPPPKLPNARYLPAPIRREVWRRDEGRCTFVGDSGHRCEARDTLEFDHVVPIAKGGTSTVANLRLLCRTHNQFAAEQEYGEGFMHEIRERARVGASGELCASP